MLKELLQALSEQAVRAAGPRSFQPAGMPSYQSMLVDSRGQLVMGQLDDGTTAPVCWRSDPEPRAHDALSLQPVIDFAKLRREQAAVWYSRDQVVCLLDDATRRDRVTLSLDYSPELLLLQEQEKKEPWQSQAELVRLLDIKLHRCLGAAGSIVEVARQLRWQVGSDTEVLIGRDKTSLGKKNTAEVTGVEKLPESVKLTVPVFATPARALGLPATSLEQMVSCALERDVPNQRLRLVPYAGQLEEAIAAAEAAIGQKLVEALASTTEADVPVYYGTP